MQPAEIRGGQHGSAHLASEAHRQLIQAGRELGLHQGIHVVVREVDAGVDDRLESPMFGTDSRSRACACCRLLKTM